MECGVNVNVLSEVCSLLPCQCARFALKKRGRAGRRVMRSFRGGLGFPSTRRAGHMMSSRSPNFILSLSDYTVRTAL